MSELLRRKEVEVMFGLKSKNTLTEWKKRGVLVPVRVGGFDYYKKADVERLFTQPTNTNTTQPAQPHKHRLVSSYCVEPGCELNEDAD